jgi:hypothetical protein
MQSSPSVRVVHPECEHVRKIDDCTDRFVPPPDGPKTWVSGPSHRCKPLVW